MSETITITIRPTTKIKSLPGYEILENGKLFGWGIDRENAVNTAKQHLREWAGNTNPGKD